MHELLGILLKVVERDAVSLEFLEHDSFTLFEALMSGMKRWFLVNEELESPITKLCRKIQFEDLPIFDCILAKHLEKSQVEPTIRWMRTLFTSEFHDAELLHLWDRIFSYDPSLQVTPYIVLVMLIQIRDELLRSNFNGIITKIIRYKSPSPSMLVEEAMELLQNPSQTTGVNLIRKYSTLRYAEGSSSPSSSAPSPPLKSNPHSRLNSKESQSGAAKTISGRPGFDKTTLFTFDEGWKSATNCWMDSTFIPGPEDLRMHTYRKDSKDRRLMRERDEMLGEILDISILKLNGVAEERKDAIAGVKHVRDVLHNDASLDTDLLRKMKEKRMGRSKIWIPPRLPDHPQNAMTIERSPISNNYDDLYSNSWTSVTKNQQIWMLGDEDTRKPASRSTSRHKHDRKAAS
ncbi:TBC1 domain family member 5 [Neolecta irregularis DAH-3]|uniref:TBC1 domain family member 5 n=1 Tax=Neolecta irregularis (strain DAH-3) TaxID=1198029 RepID=A0A1U7LNY7_NEOID|nr:TBC1 domain family member 5 [Neolecta irregularis DAH-3]|eukprot:OLL24349.1 TBC1 domain family member 5 [Neolecta irregularis DAH-3]